MSESRAQRTLVKSPPELWSELSDPAALARHLGEFGEIRITRLDPETRVVWEGDAVSGTVELDASGWGTKVTLTATVQDAPPAPDEEPPAAQEDPAPTAPEATPGPALHDPPWGEWEVREWPPQEAEAGVPWYRRELEAMAAAKAERSASIAVTDNRGLDETAGPGAGDGVAFDQRAPAVGPRPRRRFLGRLFGRQRSRLESEPDPVAEPELDPTQPEPPRPSLEALLPPPRESAVAPWAEPEPPPPPAASGPMPPAPGPDPSPPAPGPDPGPPVPRPDPTPPAPAPDPQPGPPEPVPPQISAVDAVLTSVLDDLGSAHHRPFSR